MGKYIIFSLTLHKKEVLNLKELHLYDIYTPIVKNFEKKYSFTEAKETVLKALSVLGEDEYPYGVPLSYTYIDNKIIFHGAKSGHKIDAIEANNKVSFCVYDSGYRKEGEWALNISSVIVFGKMYIVEDFEESMEICKKLSLKYTPDMEYIEDEIRTYGKATLCYELRPEHITGKIVNES